MMKLALAQYICLSPTFAHGDRLGGCHESKSCSRDTYPESYINKYTSMKTNASHRRLERSSGFFEHNILTVTLSPRTPEQKSLHVHYLASQLRCTVVPHPYESIPPRTTTGPHAPARRGGSYGSSFGRGWELQIPHEGTAVGLRAPLLELLVRY